MSRNLDLVVRARFLVASLGEDASPPWWRTEATSTAGRLMLERLFPRTATLASLETASRAACLDHDARIGRIGVYHLFRLPSADEAAIRDMVRESTVARVLEEVIGLRERQERLGALTSLAGSEEVSNGPGPVRCGTIDDLRRGTALAAMCAAYVAGFTAETPVYPYLEEAV